MPTSVTSRISPDHLRRVGGAQLVLGAGACGAVLLGLAAGGVLLVTRRR